MHVDLHVLFHLATVVFHLVSVLFHLVMYVLFHFPMRFQLNSDFFPIHF